MTEATFRTAVVRASKKVVVMLLVLSAVCWTSLPARPDDQGGEGDRHKPSARELELRVKEADAIILSYEQKVDSAKIDMKMAKVRLKFAKQRLDALSTVHKGFVPETTIHDAEQRYEEALVSIEACENDIEEAEADLALVKVRRELASEGHWTYSLNPEMHHRN